MIMCRLALENALLIRKFVYWQGIQASTRHREVENVQVVYAARLTDNHMNQGM